MKKIICVVIAAIVLVVAVLLLYKPLGVQKPEPDFEVEMEECKFDGSDEGVFSFDFNIIPEDETRMPGQFILRTRDVYIYDYNITMEYELDRVYKPNETIDASFVIDDIYEDYMYLPSENFNVELFYCEFTPVQRIYLGYIKEPFHKSLIKYCSSIYNYAWANDVPYIHVVIQNPGEQCTVITRDIEGNIKTYESK